MILKRKSLRKLILLSLIMTSIGLGAQEDFSELDLDSPDDIEVLMQDESLSDKTLTPNAPDTSDELQELRTDLGDIEFIETDDAKLLEDTTLEKNGSRPTINPVTNAGSSDNSELIFDVGREEKELLEVAKKMQGKIPENEWTEIADSSPVKTYTVVSGDWLWKISQRLFGSGFFYAKVWALNPYITNPHEIEPGMVLSFTTGTSSDLPQIRVGDLAQRPMATGAAGDAEFNQWGDEAKPNWINERERLKDEGVFVQYATGETEADLQEASEFGLIKEYEAYEPPRPDFEIIVPEDQYDDSGFDKTAKISFRYKEGFYLNTFVSTNVVQDYGKLEASIDEHMFLTDENTVYARFDDSIDIVAGDKYSIYSAAGEVEHINSDRKGYKYTIVGQIQTIQKKDGLWECKIIETTGLMQRGDRITVYTPKIDRITPTFNNRIIEAALVGAYSNLQTVISFGDVVYLDRGRADGLEMGNVLVTYGFQDRATKRNITDNPTYKTGELTIITLTDNFATALVTQSVRDFNLGDIAITKTKEDAARATMIKNKLADATSTKIKENALDELDVELNVDDLNDSLLDKADRIQFTEDELAELERQEREKSIMTEGERDLKALERLESEIDTAEKMLNEARLDEDKLLERQSLDNIEKNLGVEQQESLEEIEENFGKKYLDESLNDKDNPYGLTEFDIEEIDELLNVDENKEQMDNTINESL